MSVNEVFIKAGIKILDESGLENFSIREVTKRCGYTSSSVPYEYFSSKQVFIMAIARYMIQEWYEESKSADTAYLLGQGLTEVQARQYIALKVYSQRCEKHPWLSEVIFLLRSDKKCRVTKQVPKSMQHEPYLMKELQKQERFEGEKVPYANTSEMLMTLFIYGAKVGARQNMKMKDLSMMDIGTCINFLQKMEKFLGKDSD